MSSFYSPLARRDPRGQTDLGAVRRPRSFQARGVRGRIIAWLELAGQPRPLSENVLRWTEAGAPGSTTLRVRVAIASGWDILAGAVHWIRTPPGHFFGGIVSSGLHDST